ncbi:type I phosphomannose isomerase catalytic subunit [Deinococcus sp. YIM 77859]|uniref:type I phosphomannose isomerase catalytic subunit n=1 Tax=Deinococcus sp. YIM 77859 TaxID=1540221 RepID=UPI00054FB71B|nr:type I phosphomannose isomerase catalytic subunit [Deinococcus sp. YIM 77859]
MSLPSSTAPTRPLVLQPRFSQRVWGGTRLLPESPTPIGEAWVVYEENQVQFGPHAGYTLGELSAAHPRELLGRRAQGTRFPLLIKLLDCAEWLSVQVHPDDAQAQRLAGEGQLGKTEAWHILEAVPGAELIAGVRPGTDAKALRTAILAGRIMDYAERHTVQAGDTVLMPAGTLHALGPGLLLYEVQQTSDLTYRVYDWDRPASAGRALHLPESAEVTTTTRVAPQPSTPGQPGEVQELTRCPYFVLERLVGEGTALQADTLGESFHALTVTAGELHLTAGGETLKLGPLESVVVPAAAGTYSLTGTFQALRSRLP